MRVDRSTVVVLAALLPLLVGFGGPRPFQVAPFVGGDSDVAPGAWMSSVDVSSDDSVNVVVMATWCGYCKHMLDQLSSNSDARDQIDMVLFFDTEYEDAMRRRGHGPDEIQRGRHLLHPERVTGLPLPLYFAKRAEFGGLVSGYPTLLSCTREGCRQLSRREVGLG